MYNTLAATHWRFTLRTNIDLDDELVEQAMALSGLRTKRAVVHLALSELVRTRRKKSLLDLAGKVRFRKDYDHKAARELRRDAR